VESPEFDELVHRYARPGAFEAAIRWYQVGAGYTANAVKEQPPLASARLRTPTHVLWQELDPLFPRSWSDRLHEFFVSVTLYHADGVGHFTPLEAPQAFASLVAAAVASVEAAREPDPSAAPSRATFSRGQQV
jgi:pimeloyl-ACP methyl ester carboxylesterase